MTTWLLAVPRRTSRRFPIALMTADQLHQLLRMHVMAMSVGNVLLRHRTTIGADVLLLPRLGGRRHARNSLDRRGQARCSHARRGHGADPSERGRSTDLSCR